MRVLIFSVNFARNISPFKKKMSAIRPKTHVGLHGMYPLFLSDFFMKLEFSANIFEKIFKYHIS
jgi:hypothetical protein